jgi:hypothetical protein
MGQAVKFYLDEHVPRAVARALRQRGVDVIRAQEAGMLGATDEEHLHGPRRKVAPSSLRTTTTCAYMPRAFRTWELPMRLKERPSAKWSEA